MNYEKASKLACEAYYGDADATPGSIIQFVLAILAALSGACPPTSARRTVQRFPRLTSLRMLAASYNLKKPEGVDRNEAVALATVLALQGTDEDYTLFAQDTPPDNVKALLPN